eukprot:9969801-Alexandrium_andersonii.AAC.1
MLSSARLQRPHSAGTPLRRRQRANRKEERACSAVSKRSVALDCRALAIGLRGTCACSGRG